MRYADRHNRWDLDTRHLQSKALFGLPKLYSYAPFGISNFHFLGWGRASWIITRVE